MKHRKLPLAALILAIAFGSSAAAVAVADAEIPDLPTINRTLTLADALALARADNVALSQARADAALSLAMVGSAAAGEKPGVSATTYATTGDSNNILTTSSGVAPQDLLSVPSRGFADQNITVMVPLFTGRKLENAVGAARAQSDASESGIAESLLTVQQSVTDAYVDALLKTALVGVAQARLDAEDEQVRVTAQRVQTGASAPVDLLREQAEQADAHQGVTAAQGEVLLALVVLKSALGVSQSSTITLSDTLESVSQADPDVHNQEPSNPSPSAPIVGNPNSPVGLAHPRGANSTIVVDESQATAAAEMSRPVLAAAREQIAAARAAVAGAQSAYAPQVYGVGMADASADSQGDGSVGYTIGLTASLPLYDAGERRSEVDAAKARLARAIADAQAVRQTVDQEAASAWINSQTAIEQVTTAQTGVTAAQQAYALADLRYNAGKSTAADRLESLAALTEARGKLAESQAAAIRASIRLETATGIVHR